MEEKINIAEILKNKPQGTKLYDWLHNIDVELDTISTTDTETVVWCTNETDNNTTCHRGYSEFGTERGYTDCLQILFPSKKMRDWSRFAWKKGDVLISNDSDEHIIFKGFSKSDYTTFEGKHWINVSKKRYVSCLKIRNVQDYHIEDNKESAQTYINTIEKRLGGKLYRETLEIEKAQTEFKDGAKWAISEFLKDLLHPASEVPRNDNGKILAFSKVNSNIKLYDMNDMLNETACDTYQEMWEIRVRYYTFTDWVFVEELLDLIKKGDKNRCKNG